MDKKKGQSFHGSACHLKKPKATTSIAETESQVPTSPTAASP